MGIDRVLGNAVPQQRVPHPRKFVTVEEARLRGFLRTIQKTQALGREARVYP